MHLFRPYPDELVGSMLWRAQWQLGLPIKTMMRLLTSHQVNTAPIVIAKHQGIAKAFGMSIESLVLNHTLMPYALAFYTPKKQQAIFNSLCTGTSPYALSAISQNATVGVPHLRFCLQCIEEDMGKYGESYWRRVHQLPGVMICLQHNRPLLESNFNIHSKHRIHPPHEIRDKLVSPQYVAFPIAKCIAEVSVKALHHQIQPQDWRNHYKSIAGQLGYQFKSGHIYGEVLGQDVSEFFGSRFLTMLGPQLIIPPSQVNAWPKGMFRASSANVTPVKHVLLNVFFSSSPSPSISPSAFERRKKPHVRDWALIEKQLIARMSKVVARCKENGTRIMIKELAERCSAYTILHHHRDKVPYLVAWLQEFKSSPQAERQTGKRPRKYK